MTDNFFNSEKMRTAKSLISLRPSGKWYNQSDVITNEGESSRPNIYTVSELDRLLINKVDKYVPSRINNFASLTTDGNIKDSGLNPDDLTIEIIDLGTF